MKKWLVLLMCLCFALPVLGLSESIFDREWLDISFVHQREYTLPETEDLPYLYACTFGTLHIPAGVSDIPVLDYTFVEAYQVPDDHPLFKTVDGVLYSRDGKTLLAYPNARKASHFDVPFWVETIEKSAFAENDYLQSVSLPLTLKEIGRSSFYHCGGLISINIPLSVTEIGPYAFSSCVNLEKVSMSPALEEKVRAGANLSSRYDEDPVPFAKVFNNCPKLENSLWYGDEGVTPAEAHYSDGDKEVWLIASPKSVNEKVNLYAEPDSSSQVLMQLNCGEAIGSTYEYHPDYYVVDNLSDPYPYSQKAYIKKSDVVIAPAETLFAFASIWPKNEDVPVTMTEWDENNNSHTINKTYGEFLRSVEQGPFAEEAAYNDGQPITWDMVTTNQNTYYYSQSLPGTVSMSV
ncbi:MAG: leucine-rich repeat domain-containing protein, partial [Clostridia bacterium]|nr:leucine-rich repeat domain-containing protein [Clostridia bacterium]